PGSFDLMPNQVMQAPFLEAPNIAVRKEYRIVRSLSDDEDTVDPDGLSIPVVANLIFKNDEAQRMGRQLPTGTVRLYQADETGVLRFLGEDQIAESASGMEVRLGLGAISDLTAKWRTTDHKLNEPSSTRRSEEEKSFEVTLINRKDCLLTVHVQVDVQGDWTLLSSNFPGIKEQAHTLGFQVPVPSKGHAKLICRVRSQTTR
ncbi:MAG: hypothetical protein LWX11_09170, partial [Firmicutes bacterium]|nr:hypothetical protein [Bacillota bacterium]